MANSSVRRRAGRARKGWGLAALTLLALCLVIVGIVRFYPYETAYPDLPRLTHTHSGAAGDPINVILVGSQDEISGAFQRAGWLTPDPITPETSARIIAASLAHHSYPTAPVSNLYVFGRPQDLAFEKPTNDVQYRDHIRLWQTDQTVGVQPIWVAQASYDAGIELSGSNAFPTHHIAAAIDHERDTVGASLQKTGAVTQSALVAYTAPILFAHNGGGDFYESDGAALALDLTPTPLSVPAQSSVMSALRAGVFWLYDGAVTIGAPLLVLALVAVALVLGLVLARRFKRNRSGSTPSR